MDGHRYNREEHREIEGAFSRGTTVEGALSRGTTVEGALSRGLL